MNAARVAHLLRELAAELEAVPTPAESEPKKRTRRAPIVVPSTQPVDELAVADARRRLRRIGKYVP